MNLGNSPQLVKPHKAVQAATNTSQGGDLCETLSQALGREIRLGTTIKCFCHDDRGPSLAIYPNHAFCFSQRKRFSPAEVLRGLGLAHLSHTVEKHVHEPDVQDGYVKSNKPTGVEFARDKERLSRALRVLGFVDKAKEVEMCGKYVTQKTTGRVRTRTCGACGSTL